MHNIGVYEVLLAVLIIWSVIWKGFALWKSARNDQLWWFVALLVINTAGILEILYIWLFQRKRNA
ncbi:MAG TPA: DUF5652 family protein [Candidatus Omnitrophota bacterium]|nr:DUF5652 family protein [Candidatus Omnitrophota bacterium]